MAKILAKKCSGKLYEVTEKRKRPAFEEEKVEEIYGEILMSAKTPKRDGVERQIVANPNIKLNLSFFTLFPQIIPAFSSIPSDYS